tara:strand:+ start:134 stop:304 length:171 start_codon:yes stop_codon:yes gene_type:complete
MPNKKNGNKNNNGFFGALLRTVGITPKMQNRAGGGGTTAKGKKKTLADIRREAMGR